MAKFITFTLCTLFLLVFAHQDIAADNDDRNKAWLKCTSKATKAVNLAKRLQDKKIRICTDNYRHSDFTKYQSCEADARMEYRDKYSEIKELERECVEEADKLLF